MWGQPPPAVQSSEARYSYAAAISGSLILFDGRTFALGFCSDGFLPHRLPSRLRPLPLLIPPIMKRVVRPLFFHIPQLDTPTQT
jgi:hypothetical protein